MFFVELFNLCEFYFKYWQIFKHVLRSMDSKIFLLGYNLDYLSYSSRDMLFGLDLKVPHLQWYFCS